MIISEKIAKLLATRDNENIKLAKNIITAKMDSDNVIAIVCTLKALSANDVYEDYSMRQLINNTLAKGIPNYKERDHHSIVNLFRWSLQHFQSEENIKTAERYYTKHTEHLVRKAIEECKTHTAEPSSEEKTPFE